MTKRTTSLLIAAALTFTISGFLSAADFEKDVQNTEAMINSYKAGAQTGLQDVTPVPPPQTPAAGTRWYSMGLFGTTHSAVAKAALKFINMGAFPDMGAAKDILIEGSKDESGHLSSEKNGGPVQELWFGKTAFSKGGVLWNYEHFKFNEAYARLGAICHLTQDQAVPTHAANIKHGIGDSFEGYYNDDVKITVKRDNGDMEPWAYYQSVQDETRGKLPGWTDPETGRQYWVAAPAAPSLGQDATYGPWGHYGGQRDRDMWAVPPQNNNGSDVNNNGAWTTAHPEIRFQQLAVSGAATVSVLESASKRLPPLVQGLSISTVSARSGGEESRGFQINFNVYENRSPDVTYAVNVYRNGSLIGTAVSGAAALYPPKDGGLMFSGALTAYWWRGIVGSKPLPAGEYELSVRVLDADGNTTPEEVNSDDIPDNDTRASAVIN